MLSGANAFEISDIQEDETAAVLTKRSECNNALHCVEDLPAYQLELGLARLLSRP